VDQKPVWTGPKVAHLVGPMLCRAYKVVPVWCLSLLVVVVPKGGREGMDAWHLPFSGGQVESRYTVYIQYLRIPCTKIDSRLSPAT